MEVKFNLNKEFLKKNWVLIVLGLILLFGFGLRVYFYANTIDQTLWWDEADYMVLAKKIGTDNINAYTEWKEIWSPRRPFLFPILAGGIFKLGLGETGIRFMEIFFSMFIIWLTYLLGKDMFDKKIGLIAAFCTSVFWLQLFFSSRVLVGLPGSTFALAGLYFFWKGYIKKENHKLIYLSALFFGLALFTRHSLILFAVPLLALVLMREKFRFLKNKHLWIAILIIILILMPNFIYLVKNYENPLKKGTGFGEGRFATINSNTIPVIIDHFALFKLYLGWAFLICFLLGCLKFLDVILGYDLVFKNLNIQKFIFLFFWMITFIIFFGYQGGYFDQPMPIQPRYLLPIFPAVFMILGLGMMKIYNTIKKHNKIIAIVAVLVLLFLGASYEINHSKGLIFGKKESYMPVKISALWMKENSNPGDVIITNSVPQTRYYSEMRADYAGDALVWAKRLELYKSKNFKPKYFVVSAFEQFSGDWFYGFPARNNLKPVNVWFADSAKTQPILIVYEFPEDYINKE